ncbi:hypothetical protein K8R04_04585 [Candidatus Uhrbacteria bacterium]|nr:hypothetical protein [Candidatus Uhrbacteria bacterium]
MSLLAEPVLPPVPTAPHTRVHHIFYTAPYIKTVFDGFLEAHPECSILETDAMVRTLSGIYVLGRKFTPDFWKDSPQVVLMGGQEQLLALLELMRNARGKHKGRRPWEYFQPLWNQLTQESLPSRKSHETIAFNESEAETMVRIRLVYLVMRLVEARISPPDLPAPAISRPKRIAGRITRRNKSEP